MTAITSERPSTTTDEPVLFLEGIGKRFGAVQALTDVSLQVSEGEVVALVGDNGAGKSTLVKIIAGVYQADGGEMTFARPDFDQIPDPRFAQGPGGPRRHRFPEMFGKHGSGGEIAAASDTGDSP